MIPPITESQPLNAVASPPAFGDYTSSQVTHDPVQVNLFTRRVYALATLNSLYNFIICWCYVNNQENWSFHPSNWGLDAGLLTFAIALLVLVGCFGRMVRSSPLIWVIWVLFVLTDGYLTTALLAYFNNELVLYCVTLQLAGIASLYGSVVTTKSWASFGGSALFLLTGIFIVYEIFLIFTDIKLHHLICEGVITLILGLYLNYDVPTILPGNFYRLDPASDSTAGSLVIWLEIALSPVRVCELIGKNMWKHNAQAAPAPAI